DFAVTNTAPDQTVALTDGGNGNVTIGGTYPNFTIDVPNATVDTDEQDLSNTVVTANESVRIDITDGASTTIDIRDADNDPNNENQTVSAGTGISVSQSGDDFAVTNTAPDQTVALTDGGNGNVTIGGTYPNFTIDVPDATVDTNTEYTAGSGLNLASTVFSADVSNTAGNALSIDANGLYVSDTDNDTQYSAGTGLDLTVTEFSVAENGITNTELANDAVQANNILNEAVTLSKLADGNVDGQVMQWDGSNWILVDLGSVTVTENDGVIGNEVVGVTGGNNTLTRSGDGSQAVPYTLAVSADGITNNELADDAVDLANIAAGSASGDLIQWNGTDWEFVAASSLNTDTQYTAGSGLNLAGTVFSADVSNTAGNALSIDANGLYVSNVDNVEDADSDPNNENQTVSAGTGISVSQSGDDFAVTNTAPDQTVALTDGGNGNVTIGGTYPNFTIDVPNATVDTDEQDLSNTVVTANESVRIDITDGASTTIDIRDADNDP
ncbi:beta strand repeat-containing protein, partial [Maribacter ulvicola]